MITNTYTIKHKPNKFINRGDRYFIFEIYIYNYIEYAITSSMIKYNDDITTKVEKLSNLVAGDLVYV
jgi:hypothetical protein